MNKEKTCLNISCLKEACISLSIPFDQIDKFGNFIIVKIKDKKYHFIYWNTPFNNSALVKLCKDKDYSILFIKDEIGVPKTKSYINPKCLKKNRMFLDFFSISEIVKDIENNFSFPLIIKMNSGSMGKNVFLCQNSFEIESSLNKIFNKRSLNYDFIALAQEYINIKREFRVIRFRGENLLIYEKIAKDKTKNQSPLHNPNSFARIIEKTDIVSKEIESFLSESQKINQFEFVGIDLAIDQKDNFKLLEINSSPGFSIIAEHAGRQKIVDLYKKILLKL